MDKQRILQYQSLFDEIVQHVISEDGSEQVEVWFARELQGRLGYARWENFVVAIRRAVDSCNTQGFHVDDHFREVTKMVELGSGRRKKDRTNHSQTAETRKRRINIFIQETTLFVCYRHQFLEKTKQ